MTENRFLERHLFSKKFGY